MNRNRNNVYAEDLRGYDALYRFSDIFPTIEVWAEKVNSYMFDFTIDTTDEKEIKIFNILLNRYKTNFFRWKNVATIYSKMANEYTVLQKRLKRQEDFADLTALTGTTNTVENYKTNNTATEDDAENNTRYRTDITTDFTDDSRLYIEMVDRRTNTGDIVNSWIDELKTNFMNYTDEVVTKEGIYDK